MAAFLLDRPSSAGRDLAVIEKPGTVYSAVFSFIHDKWQVSPKLTLDLGLRHEYYTPFVGVQRQGGLSNYDPVTNQLLVSGYGDIPRQPRRQVALPQLQPAARACPTASTDRQVVRAGYGVSTIPFGDNTYAFNFPVKQNNQFNAANAFIPPAGHLDGGRLPGPGRGADPVERPHRRRRRRAAAQRRLLLLPDRPARKACCTRGTSPTSASWAPTSPPKSPTSATTARTSSSASTSTPATRSAPATTAARSSPSSGGRPA